LELSLKDLVCEKVASLIEDSDNPKIILSSIQLCKCYEKAYKVHMQHKALGEQAKKARSKQEDKERSGREEKERSDREEKERQKNERSERQKKRAERENKSAPTTSQENQGGAFRSIGSEIRTATGRLWKSRRLRGEAPESGGLA